MVLTSDQEETIESYATNFVERFKQELIEPNWEIERKERHQAISQLLSNEQIGIITIAPRNAL